MGGNDPPLPLLSAAPLLPLPTGAPPCGKPFMPFMAFPGACPGGGKGAAALITAAQAQGRPRMVETRGFAARGQVYTRCSAVARDVTVGGETRPRRRWAAQTGSGARVMRGEVRGGECAGAAARETGGGEQEGCRIQRAAERDGGVWGVRCLVWVVRRRLNSATEALRRAEPSTQEASTPATYTSASASTPDPQLHTTPPGNAAHSSACPSAYRPHFQRYHRSTPARH